MKSGASQNGNILFLILLAIVLFAALAYAVTNSIRGGGKDASDDKMQTAATSILGYMSMVRNEVQRIMLVNNCTLSNLDWRDGTYKRYDESLINNTAPSSPKAGCAVFQAQGGPLIPLEFSKYETLGFSQYMIDTSQTTRFKSGNFAFRWANMIGQGTDRTDMSMVMEGVDNRICLALAQRYNPSVTTILADTFTLTTYPTAEPTSTAASDVIGDGIYLQNQNNEGIYFGPSVTINGTVSCRLGYIIVPQ